MLDGGIIEDGGNDGMEDYEMEDEGKDAEPGEDVYVLFNTL